MAAPGFVNAAGGDYHLVAGAAAENAGVTDSFVGTEDFEGDSRVGAGIPDVGADERRPATVPETAITGAPPASGTDPTVTFYFASDDATATFTCSVAGSFPGCAMHLAVHVIGASGRPVHLHGDRDERHRPGSDPGDVPVPRGQHRAEHGDRRQGPHRPDADVRVVLGWGAHGDIPVRARRGGVRRLSCVLYRAHVDWRPAYAPGPAPSTRQATGTQHPPS